MRRSAPAAQRGAFRAFHFYPLRGECKLKNYRLKRQIFHFYNFDKNFF
jgi:hypothetical protein